MKIEEICVRFFFFFCSQIKIILHKYLAIEREREVLASTFTSLRGGLKASLESNIFPALWISCYKITNLSLLSGRREEGFKQCYQLSFSCSRVTRHICHNTGSNWPGKPVYGNFRAPAHTDSPEISVTRLLGVKLQ